MNEGRFEQRVPAYQGEGYVGRKCGVVSVAVVVQLVRLLKERHESVREREKGLRSMPRREG